jgi:hypothetical protein
LTSISRPGRGRFHCGGCGTSSRNGAQPLQLRVVAARQCALGFGLDQHLGGHCWVAACSSSSAGTRLRRLDDLPHVDLRQRGCRCASVEPPPDNGNARRPAGRVLAVQKTRANNGQNRNSCQIKPYALRCPCRPGRRDLNRKRREVSRFT